MIASDGRDPVIVKLPIYTAADIAQGALIMPGVTADTDLGLCIVGSGAVADAIGALRAPYDFSEEASSLVAGTAWKYREVELFDQYRLIEVEYDKSDTAAVASTSGTTVTITSLEDNIDTSWLYAVSGTGIGKLAFLTASASGSATSKTATAWDSTTTVIKILRVGHQLAKLNTAGTMIGTDAAAGSWTVAVLENYMDFNGERFLLDPTKHDNGVYSGARFFAKLLVRNTIGHTTE